MLWFQCWPTHLGNTKGIRVEVLFKCDGYLLRKSQQQTLAGRLTEGQLADDASLTVKSHVGTECAAVVFNSAATDFGLTVSLGKTEFMALGTVDCVTQNKVPVVIRESQIERIDKFHYLGSRINNTDRSSLDTNIRMQPLLKDLVFFSKPHSRTHFSITSKCRIFSTCILPLLQDGNQGWLPYSKTCANSQASTNFVFAQFWNQQEECMPMAHGPVVVFTQQYQCSSFSCCVLPQKLLTVHIATSHDPLISNTTNALVNNNRRAVQHCCCCLQWLKSAENYGCPQVLPCCCGPQWTTTTASSPTSKSPVCYPQAHTFTSRNGLKHDKCAQATQMTMTYQKDFQTVCEWDCHLWRKQDVSGRRHVCSFFPWLLDMQDHVT